MSKLLALSVLFLSSNLAHAGHESYGGGMCSHADVYCVTPEKEKKGGDVTVCLFGDKRVQAIVSIDKKSGSVSRHFEVTKQPVDRHLMGAPLRYSGEGMELSIGATTAPTPIGQHANLTIDDLGLSDKTIYCKFQN